MGVYLKSSKYHVQPQCIMKCLKDDCNVICLLGKFDASSLQKGQRYRTRNTDIQVSIPRYSCVESSGYIHTSCVGILLDKPAIIDTVIGC